MTKLYQRRIVPVEANQWDGINTPEIMDWLKRIGVRSAYFMDPDKGVSVNGSFVHAIPARIVINSSVSVFVNMYIVRLHEMYSGESAVRFEVLSAEEFDEKYQEVQRINPLLNQGEEIWFETV